MSSIGVLAVQGAFAEHATRLRSLGCDVVELRQAADLTQPLDGLVLPGGESTVQSKLLADLGMLDPLHALVAGGVPTLGTCAGLILMAKHVEGSVHGRGPAAIEGLCTLPVTVERNGYGRQLASFRARAPLASTSPQRDIPLTFIRAPRITQLDPDVEVLVALDAEPVAVRHGNQIGCCFHPELDTDDGIYELFCSLMRQDK